MRKQLAGNIFLHGSRSLVLLLSRVRFRLLRRLNFRSSRLNCDPVSLTVTASTTIMSRGSRSSAK